MRNNLGTEPQKGGAETLSRNLGSPTSIGKFSYFKTPLYCIKNKFNLVVLEDNNPDVVPQEAIDGEYISEEKAFDRLKTGGFNNQRILYTPHISTTPSLSPTSTFSSTKPYGELCLTTNPVFALYNSPQRRPPPLYATPKLQSDAGSAIDGRVNSNIYTRIPTRPFSPYDNRQSPVSPTSYSSGVTMPLLLQHYQQQGSSAVMLTKSDDYS